MRILVLTKRQYTGKDLLDDRYGRLFEIPAGLAAQGHDVLGLALSYRPKATTGLSPQEGKGVEWRAINALPFSPIGATRHLLQIETLCKKFRPDLVWASSDAWHAIAAGLICRRLNIPYIVDLYDNYESFGLTATPGVVPLFRQACRHASGLSLISGTLQDYLRQHYRLPADLPCLPLGNAVDIEYFRPLNKQLAREKLGLPYDAVIIGTAGALDRGRGISTLFEAFEILTQKIPAIRLVIAGPRDSTVTRYPHLPINDLGILSATEMPSFWNALDVAVIQNRDSNFGRYCYPQKLQEIIACGTPLVASAVGEVARMLSDHPGSLADPDSPAILAKSLAHQIMVRQQVDRSKLKTWLERATELSSFFESIVSEKKQSSQT